MPHPPLKALHSFFNDRCTSVLNTVFFWLAEIHSGVGPVAAVVCRGRTTIFGCCEGLNLLVAFYFFHVCDSKWIYNSVALCL